jgi:putative FmdB family regulatory protein
MPLYEYRCRKCSERFEALVFGKKRPACPKCESRDLEKLLSAFAVGSKGGNGATSPGGCGTCGDPRGPGSCEMD